MSCPVFSLWVLHVLHEELEFAYQHVIDNELDNETYLHINDILNGKNERPRRAGCYQIMIRQCQNHHISGWTFQLLLRICGRTGTDGVRNWCLSISEVTGSRSSPECRSTILIGGAAAGDIAVPGRVSLCICRCPISSSAHNINLAAEIRGQLTNNRKTQFSTHGQLIFLSEKQ